MTKDWYTNILKCYRHAYYDCLAHFRDYYPIEWKDKMKDIDEVIGYFAQKKLLISIEVEPTEFQNKFSFRFLITGVIEVKSGCDYTSTNQAQMAALEHAFMIWNFRLTKDKEKKAKRKDGLPAWIHRYRE